MDDEATPAVLRLNDQLGQASEARWYCLDRDGVAMLCKDEEDARAQVIESDDCWPQRAPHRAVLLGDVAAERERCAKLCDVIEEGRLPDGSPVAGMAGECAWAIREGLGA